MAANCGFSVLGLLTLIVSTIQAADAYQPVLLPAVHWNHDKADLQHLLPTDTHKLYYSTGGVADPNVEHAFAHLSANLAHPAVILDHSHFIESVKCQGHNLEISFSHIEAYAFAKEAWVSVEHFVLATYTTDCGDATDQRSFWLIDRLIFGHCATCITAVVQQELAVEDAIHGVEMVWGTYAPADNSAPAARPQMQRRETESGSHGTHECGHPPSAEIDGFPTATCNSTTFDEDLDDAIGYLPFDEAEYSQNLKSFAPGLGDFTPGSNQGFGPILQDGTRLTRRQNGGWFGDLVAKSLARTFDRAAEALRSLPAAVIKGAENVAKKVSDALVFSPDVRLKFGLGTGPPKLLTVQSPFGEAFQLLQETRTSKGGSTTGQLTVYCVDCGVLLSGQAKWTIKEGLRSAVVGINGTIRAGLSLGIDAEVTVHQAFEQPIGAVGIPGYQIPGIIVVGPSLSLAAIAELDVTLAGQVLAGAELIISNLTGSVDFIDGTKSKSGFPAPQLNPIFEATGSVGATLALGLPLSLGVGLQIPAIKFKKTVSINNVPTIEASATYSITTTSEDTDEGTDEGTDEDAEEDVDENADETTDEDEDEDVNTDEVAGCNNGIDYKLEFVNTVYADLFGLTKFTLNRYNQTLVEGCKLLGGSSPNSTVIDVIDEPYYPIPQPAKKPYKRFIKRQVDGPSPFDYVESLPTNATSANDTLFQTINNASFASLDSTAAGSLNGSQSVNAPDTVFLNITDQSGNDALVANEDGNIYYADPGDGSEFAVVGRFVEGDAAGRFFHYYPDTMAAYNVSRIRLSDETHVPRTAGFISLAPVNHDDDLNTPDVYVAVDTLGEIFFPVTCDIQDQESKAFLVRDLDQGVQKLLDPKLRYTVTGGIVEECYFLPWLAPAGSADAISAPGNGTAP
ncbi:MAG: hypothetical protein Q9219_006510 [cf. Caloplaca sp. 3 TL-2023]